MNAIQLLHVDMMVLRLFCVILENGVRDVVYSKSRFALVVKVISNFSQIYKPFLCLEIANNPLKSKLVEKLMNLSRLAISWMQGDYGEILGRRFIFNGIFLLLIFILFLRSFLWLFLWERVLDQLIELATIQLIKLLTFDKCKIYRCSSIFLCQLL